MTDTWQDTSGFYILIIYILTVKILDINYAFRATFSKLILCHYFYQFQEGSRVS